MGQALYRKYRSRALDEVVGQDHIIKTLQNALKSGRISHAYLFSGPRGVGKTSVARILAHEINGLDYAKDSVHLDIIEIDAASNRRIDEIRDLRERVHIAPTSAKYKVYIIDEVHMLTREAFNALLKTLEEPPAHCVFILATTEAHKLPETIVSRTQHFNFKPIASTTAATHLKTIAKQEKITISAAALDLLAEHGGGSFRDSISFLDQLSSLGSEIDEPQVREMLGLPPDTAVDRLLEHVQGGDSRSTLNAVNELNQQGVNPLAVAKAIGQRLRTQILDGQNSAWTTQLLRRLTRLAASPEPQEKLEIDLLEAAQANQSSTTPQPEADLNSPLEDEPEVEKGTQTPEPEPQKTSLPPKSAAAKAEFSLELWPEVLDAVKSQAASLYTALRLAEPRLEDDRLILAFQFPLHEKKLKQAKSLALIGQIIEDITGSKLAIECLVDKDLAPRIEKIEKTPTASDNASLQTISNIFGAAEVLES